MIIELISIGDELLKGIIVNTNAAFLSRHLQQQDILFRVRQLLPDEQESLQSRFQEA